MIIGKAIEILADFRRQESALLGDEFAQATALGIEALTAWRQYRSKRAPADFYLLPGETKD